MEYGRILAIADVYDALHRKNSKYGESKYLTDEEIKQKMLEGNTDRVDLIEDLYEAGIFQ
jgi:HD-GYP domain-containing protein (c-di-GMP phosphodiesterase class II)